MNEVEPDLSGSSSMDIDKVVHISEEKELASRLNDNTRKPSKLHRKVNKKSTVSAPTPTMSTERKILSQKGVLDSQTTPNSPFGKFSSDMPPFKQKTMETKSASWSYLPVLKTGQLDPSEMVHSKVDKEVESAKIIQRAYRLHLIRLHFKKIKELNTVSLRSVEGITHPASARISTLFLVDAKSPDIPLILEPRVLEIQQVPLIAEDSNITIVLSPGEEIVDLKQMFESEWQSQRVDVFNRKPKECVKLYMKNSKGDDIVEEFAIFLNTTPGLHKSRIGELLGEPDEIYIKILKKYVSLQKFTSLSFEEALRLFMQKFKLQGEAQKIDRIMSEFATQYCADNPNVFKSTATAYVLAFSTIMLNTDAHNQNIKKKMTLQEFLKNNRGIDEGRDLGESFLKSLYFDIKFSEIKMNDNSERGTDIWNNITPKPIAIFKDRKLIAQYELPELKDIDKNIPHKFLRHVFLFSDMVAITRINNPKKFSLKRRIYLQDLKISKNTVNPALFMAILSSEDKQSAFTFSHKEALDVFTRHIEQAIANFNIDRDNLIIFTKKQIEERYGNGLPSNYSESNLSMSSVRSSADVKESNPKRVSFKGGLISKPVILSRRRSNTQAE